MKKNKIEITFSDAKAYSQQLPLVVEFKQPEQVQKIARDQAGERLKAAIDALEPLAKTDEDVKNYVEHFEPLKGYARLWDWKAVIDVINSKIGRFRERDPSYQLLVNFRDALKQYEACSKTESYSERITDGLYYLKEIANIDLKFPADAAQKLHYAREYIRKTQEAFKEGIPDVLKDIVDRLQNQVDIKDKKLQAEKLEKEKELKIRELESKIKSEYERIFQLSNIDTIRKFTDALERFLVIKRASVSAESLAPDDKNKLRDLYTIVSSNEAKNYLADYLVLAKLESTNILSQYQCRLLGNLLHLHLDEVVQFVTGVPGIMNAIMMSPEELSALTSTYFPREEEPEPRLIDETPPEESLAAPISPPEPSPSAPWVAAKPIPSAISLSPFEDLQIEIFTQYYDMLKKYVTQKITLEHQVELNAILNENIHIGLSLLQGDLIAESEKRSQPLAVPSPDAISEREQIKRMIEDDLDQIRVWLQKLEELGVSVPTASPAPSAPIIAAPEPAAPAASPAPIPSEPASTPAPPPWSPAAPSADAVMRRVEIEAEREKKAKEAELKEKAVEKKEPVAASAPAVTTAVSLTKAEQDKIIKDAEAIVANVKFLQKDLDALKLKVESSQLLQVLEMINAWPVKIQKNKSVLDVSKMQAALAQLKELEEHLSVLAGRKGLHIGVRPSMSPDDDTSKWTYFPSKEAREIAPKKKLTEEEMKIKADAKAIEIALKAADKILEEKEREPEKELPDVPDFADEEIPDIGTFEDESDLEEELEGLELRPIGDDEELPAIVDPTKNIYKFSLDKTTLDEEFETSARRIGMYDYFAKMAKDKFVLYGSGGVQQFILDFSRDFLCNDVSNLGGYHFAFITQKEIDVDAAIEQAKGKPIFLKYGDGLISFYHEGKWTDLDKEEIEKLKLPFSEKEEVVFSQITNVDARKAIEAETHYALSVVKEYLGVSDDKKVEEIFAAWSEGPAGFVVNALSQFGRAGEDPVDRFIVRSPARSADPAKADPKHNLIFYKGQFYLESVFTELESVSELADEVTHQYGPVRALFQLKERDAAPSGESKFGFELIRIEANDEDLLEMIQNGVFTKETAKPKPVAAPVPEPDEVPLPGRIGDAARSAWGTLTSLPGRVASLFTRAPSPTPPEVKKPTEVSPPPGSSPPLASPPPRPTSAASLAPASRAAAPAPSAAAVPAVPTKVLTVDEKEKLNKLKKIVEESAKKIQEKFKLLIAKIPHIRIINPSNADINTQSLIFLLAAAKKVIDQGQLSSVKGVDNDRINRLWEIFKECGSEIQTMLVEVKKAMLAPEYQYFKNIDSKVEKGEFELKDTDRVQWNQVKANLEKIPDSSAATVGITFGVLEKIIEQLALKNGTTFEAAIAVAKEKREAREGIAEAKRKADATATAEAIRLHEIAKASSATPTPTPTPAPAPSPVDLTPPAKPAHEPEAKELPPGVGKSPAPAITPAPTLPPDAAKPIITPAPTLPPKWSAAVPPVGHAPGAPSFFAPPAAPAPAASAKTYAEAKRECDEALARLEKAVDSLTESLNTFSKLYESPIMMFAARVAAAEGIAPPKRAVRHDMPPPSSPPPAAPSI